VPVQGVSNTQPLNLLVFSDGDGYLGGKGSIRSVNVLETLIADGLLPATRGVTLSQQEVDRAICGISSGGVCAFNAAWHRPDAVCKRSPTRGLF